LPLLPPFWSNLAMSFVSIAYGMRWERYSTAWISVVMNVVFTALLLGSSDLPIMIYIILFSYVVLGAIVAWKNIDTLYSLFGTKTFGALTLTVSLSTVDLLGWASSISDWAFRYSDTTSVFLVSWVVIALIVHLFGWMLFGRRNKK